MTHDDYDMPCHPLCRNFGLHIQLMEFVTHLPPPPPPLPPYFNARVYLLKTQCGLLLLSLFISSQLPILAVCPIVRTDATFVHMPPLSNAPLLFISL